VTYTDDGMVDGTYDPGITTLVVDSTLTTVETVDGTHDLGINTGEDGKYDGGGKTNVAIDGGGTVVTTYEVTIGILVGNLESGIDVGMIVVTDGAMIIVFDVVTVKTKMAGADDETNVLVIIYVVVV
jgi:hypothetical protein